jgi:hypothetical protein
VVETLGDTVRTTIAIMLAVGGCHAAAMAQTPSERLYLCQAAASGPAGEVSITANQKGPIALAHVAWYPQSGPQPPATDPKIRGRTALYYNAPSADPTRMKLKNMTVAVVAAEGRACPVRAEINISSQSSLSRTETFSCFGPPRRVEIDVSNFAGGDEDFLAAIDVAGEATIRGYDQDGEFSHFRLDLSDKAGRDRLFQSALADLNRIREEPERHLGDPRQPHTAGTEAYCWDAQIVMDQIELGARRTRRQSAE